MRIETERLIITDFTMDMAEDVHLNSLDEDNRRFVPDEVFETVEEARETVAFLMGRYGGAEGPFVHPILLKTGENIGYVQLVNIGDGWELGYHIAKAYTGKGYATEAARAFLPAIRPGHGEVRLHEPVHGRGPLSGGTAAHRQEHLESVTHCTKMPPDAAWRSAAFAFLFHFPAWMAWARLLSTTSWKGGRAVSSPAVSITSSNRPKSPSSMTSSRFQESVSR